MLYSSLFECEVEIELALVWAIKEYRHWDLTPEMVQELSKSSIFWTNKWTPYKETREIFDLVLMGKNYKI